MYELFTNTILSMNYCQQELNFKEQRVFLKILLISFISLEIHQLLLNLNIILGVETRRAAKNRASSVEIIAPNAIFEQTRERERRITKCFSCIFITFLVCFTPWALVSEFDPMPPSDKV